MIFPRRWFISTTLAGVAFILFTGLLLRNGVDHATEQIQDISNDIKDTAQDLKDKILPPPTGPRYKPKKPLKALPIVDNFPLALAAHSASELPPIPVWSRPPNPHVAEKTPLFIGFTRNWRLLQQVVVSYITSGWPPEDIYVVENTGVLDANKLGQLSLQNPFFLNHTRLEMLGVNILITPTLFTFAQLQNFYLWTSTVEKWTYYFWSHMDVVAVPFENNYPKDHPDVDITSKTLKFDDFKSVYNHCVDALREVLATPDLRWAMRFFSYDRLALVNVSSFREIGGWDTMIPFYMTDCDMHARLEMAKFDIQDRPAGLVYDVASSLDDLIVLYRKKSGPDGVAIKQASFVDPNVQEAELAAKAAADSLLEKSGKKKPEEAPKIRKRVDAANSSTKAFEEAVKAGTRPAPASNWEEDTIKSPNFDVLERTLDTMQNSKNSGERNKWQSRQGGGVGEPFYRDSEGFETAIQMTIAHGRNIFSEKWGHRDCDIVAKGYRPEDAWRVDHDW